MCQERYIMRSYCCLKVGWCFDVLWFYPWECISRKTNWLIMKWKKVGSSIHFCVFLVNTTSLQLRPKKKLKGSQTTTINWKTFGLPLFVPLFGYDGHHWSDSLDASQRLKRPNDKLYWLCQRNEMLCSKIIYFSKKWWKRKWCHLLCLGSKL